MYAQLIATLASSAVASVSLSCDDTLPLATRPTEDGWTGIQWNPPVAKERRIALASVTRVVMVQGRVKTSATIVNCCAIGYSEL